MYVCVYVYVMYVHIYVYIYVLNPVENLSSAYFLQVLNYVPLHSQITLIVYFSS